MAKKQKGNFIPGRHAVGGQLARPGTPRGGQSAPVGNRPITASRPEHRPRPPVLFDAADTSRDAQKLIVRPPQPLDNPYGAKNVPAPANRNYSQKAGLPARNLHGGAAHGGSEITQVGCGNTSLSKDEMAAVGYGPNETKGSWSIISGQPTGGKKQSGRPGSSSRGTSGAENRRVRQEP